MLRSVVVSVNCGTWETTGRTSVFWLELGTTALLEAGATALEVGFSLLLEAGATALEAGFTELLEGSSLLEAGFTELELGSSLLELGSELLEDSTLLELDSGSSPEPDDEGLTEIAVAS